MFSGADHLLGLQPQNISLGKFCNLLFSAVKRTAFPDAVLQVYDRSKIKVEAKLMKESTFLKAFFKGLTQSFYLAVGSKISYSSKRGNAALQICGDKEGDRHV